MGRKPRVYKRHQHHIDLIGEHVRRTHSLPYRAKPTAKKFATAEINRILLKR